MEDEIRQLLQEACDLYQEACTTNSTKLGAVLARLQVRFYDRFDSSLREIINEFFVQFVRSGQPVTDELVQLCASIQRQPQLAQWLQLIDPEEDEDLEEMTCKVKTQPKPDMAVLQTLGCTFPPYLTFPDVWIFRCTATPEQCEQLKSLSYVQSVEPMPIYKAQ